MHIVSLATNDIPAIIAIAQRTWPVSYAGVLTPAQIANMLATIYSPENLQNEMAQGHQFFAALTPQGALGFASSYRMDPLSRVREREDFPKAAPASGRNPGEGAITWLRKLYILPEHQGRGLGQALMATALNAFGPVAYHRLLVNRNNTAAQRFYTQLGFTKIDEVDVQMGDFHFRDFVFSRTAI